jgi:putative transposase
VYEEARAKHPERWNRCIRKWEYRDTEWLNPRQEKEIKNEAKVS